MPETNSVSFKTQEFPRIIWKTDKIAKCDFLSYTKFVTYHDGITYMQYIYDVGWLFFNERRKNWEIWLKCQIDFWILAYKLDCTE